MVEALAERTALDARLVEFVAWAPVLQGLPEDARDALVRTARIVSYPRRTAIFHEGDRLTILEPDLLRRRSGRDEPYGRP